MTKPSCFGCQYLEQVQANGIICICKLFDKPVGEDTTVSFRVPRPLEADCWTMRKEESS